MRLRVSALVLFEVSNQFLFMFSCGIICYTYVYCDFCITTYVYTILKALQGNRSSSVLQLQKENALLEQSKECLEEELISLRQELVSSKEVSNSKEIEVLKKVVNNLEVKH